MLRNHGQIGSLILERELGHKTRPGTKDRLQHHVYSSIKCVRSWEPEKTCADTHHGGLFNFAFSTDGSLLAAACEKKSLLLFDPLNGKLICAKNNAHSDCVNCVRFLDTRTFVSCSDDTTVCLWDARYLKQKIRTLRGHSNWVKNIEYAPDPGYLITSGFDGSIYLWDINRYSEQGTEGHQVFHTSGLMRTKISPDGTKLIVSTAGGYLMVIHDLDLHNLAKDLHGFKPNMYRLMQTYQWPSSQAQSYNYLFTQRRNRVELICDFPAQDKAEMIASLEVHPHGWSVVSRNTTSDEDTEWTCVHDIQEYNHDERNLNDQNDDSSSDRSNDVDKPVEALDESSNVAVQPANNSPINPSADSERPTFVLSISIQNPSTSGASSSGNSTNNVTTTSTWQPMPTSTSGEAEGERLSSTQSWLREQHTPATRVLSVSSGSGVQSVSRGTNTGDNLPAVSVGDAVTFVIQPGSDIAERTLMLLGQNRLLNPQPNTDSAERMANKVHQCRSRLTHYIEEPNVGRGFIKEVSFSSDGRLVCSPFAFGLRLLSFDSGCREMCDCLPQSPAFLREVTTNVSHSNVCVTCKWSPTHCLLVSGCLNGKVDFHQPLL